MASKKKKTDRKELQRRQLLQKALEGRMSPEQAEKAARFMWMTWGSIGNILSAPEEALAAVSGMDEGSARYLHLTLELARACLDEQTDSVRWVMDRQTAVELFRPLYLGMRAEAVGVILLDTGSRVIYSGIVCEGAVSAVPLYVRKLVRLCIDYDADSFLLAHNHISGIVEPSKQDILTTRQLEMALGCIQVRLRDHIILTDNGDFSFSESGILSNMVEETLQRRRRELTESLDIADELEEIGWAIEK